MFKIAILMATFLYTEAPRYEPRAWMEGHDRFPDGAALMFAQNGSRRLVVPGFYATADANISFDGERVLFSGRHTRSTPWQIFELPLLRGAPRQITSGDTDCIRPFYLPENRIVYTRVVSGKDAAESFIETASLVDGKTQRLSFVPNRYLTDDVLRDGRILFEAGTAKRELYTVYPDGTGVEAVRCDHGPDRGNGRQLSSGDLIFDLVSGGLARFTSARAEQVSDAPKLSGPIAEVSPSSWIVSERSASGYFGLYVWDTAAKRLTPIETPHDANAVDPVIVASRIAPTRFPSGLVPTRKTGNLLCLNARVSRTPMTDTPLATVRVYTQGNRGVPQVLGETAIEPDGSFFIEVPADKPIRMELVDAAGRTVRAERDWFWMRPSEQRICVGCHAGPERAPENKVPAILLKTTIPVKMLEAK